MRHAAVMVGNSARPGLIELRGVRGCWSATSASLAAKAGRPQPRNVILSDTTPCRFRSVSPSPRSCKSPRVAGGARQSLWGWAGRPRRIVEVLRQIDPRPHHPQTVLPTRPFSQETHAMPPKIRTPMAGCRSWASPRGTCRRRDRVPDAGGPVCRRPGLLDGAASRNSGRTVTAFHCSAATRSCRGSARRGSSTRLAASGHRGTRILVSCCGTG